MDIPALSMNMAQGQLQTDIGVALLSKSMDMAEVLGEGMAEILEQSVTPELGSSVDIRL